MRKYICDKCGGDQYSSSSEKANEPCIYCGNGKTRLVRDDYGFRLTAKIGGRWHCGVISYATEDLANKRIDELVAVGHKKENIKVLPEIDLFN